MSAFIINRQHIKRFIGAILAAVFLMSLSLPAVAADTYHYGVAGRTLFPCTYSNMPMEIDGVLMAPIPLLTEGGLGISAVYEPEAGFYRIYNKSTYIVYNLNRPGSFDINWTYDNKSIVRRNGVFYVPLHHFAERFGLNVSTFSTSYGTVTRISLVSETVTDKSLQQSISSQLSRAQDSYRSVNGLTPSPPPKPAPVVYLGFDADAGSDVSGVLDALDAQKISATFFVTPEFAESGGARSIIVRGHTLGIRLDGEYSLDALTHANQALRLSALTQTRILRMSGETNDETRELLDSNGYRLWEWEIDGQSSDLFKTIDSSKNASYVRFGCDDTSVEALNKLLTQLEPLNAEYYAVNEAQPPVMS